MRYPFKIGNIYTRKDVYRIIGIPEDTRGGNWDTGYSSHHGDYFIFCNINTSGRTGHNYSNQWVGHRLEWYGKKDSRLQHSSIQQILSKSCDTYIFWREDNKKPFTFAGVGIAEEFEDNIPVKIIWTFETGVFPDEITDSQEVFPEGAVSTILVNAYERNPLARKKCIDYYGTSCFTCGFNFEKAFGKLGEGLIHIHHLQKISEVGKEYQVDPIKDMRPVCPNCHAMIHRFSKPFSIEELKDMLQQSDRRQT